MSATRRRRTANEDRAEGFMDKITGRVKEAGGALTGNRSAQAQGRRRQMRGTAKEKKGLLKKLFS